MIKKKREKKNIIGVLFIALAVLFVLCPRLKAQESFYVFCFDVYEATKKCPEDVCQVVLEKTEGGIPESFCRPLKCTDIEGKKCPAEFCATMEDCSGDKICHYQMQGERPECGDLAYAGQDVECCEGLVKRCGIAFFDDTCDMEGKGSIYNLAICIPCGNDTCEQFENHCNCPEDCEP